MAVFLMLMMLLGDLVGLAVGQCPGVCSCIAGNTRLICTGSTDLSIPNFPNDIRQSATELRLGNAITSIRATDLQGFVNLQTLSLTGNRISSIEEGSFSTNIALGTLDLSNNDLREIPDYLFNFTTLFSLNLRGNLLQNVTTQTFLGVQEGATILLQDNVLRTLPEDTFSALHELNLDNNPLRCDCELRWLPAFIQSSTRVTTGSCNVPAHLNGVDLDLLTQDQLLCNCTPSCVNGTCNMTVGECECNDGYVGDVCDTSCPIGSFGTNCAQNCTCLSERESSPCNHVDGTCNCLPGYIRSTCEQECPDGFYGQDCLDVCNCVNGDCDFITGFCNCSIGYVGVACDMICRPLRYGLGCSENCTCQTGNCHHITGVCSCPVGYFGSNCDHNCTEAADCADIGREECSLQTVEQTCGPCLQGHIGESGDGNTECILCSGSPNCSAINRAPCAAVENTCGPCFLRHLTVSGQEGVSNEPCFDPCVDGIMNYNETDIDCGGPLCPPCSVDQVCTRASDCGIGTICLGYYSHPSGLTFPYEVQANNTCVPSDEPGRAIIDRFINALRGRENPLPDLRQNLDFTLEALESSVEREIQEQFNVQEPLDSIAISELDQAPGDVLYQTLFTFREGSEEGVDQMIQNIHDGKLLGTVLLNRRNRKVLHNL